MKKTAIYLDNPKSKILIIAPNINDSIIATALMIKSIDAAKDIERLDISVIFINNDIDELEISSSIKKIYLLGVGPHNCDISRINRFLGDYHDQIYFWITNHADLGKEINYAVKKCSNLSRIIIGNKPSITHLLIDTLSPTNIPKEWLLAADALSNHKTVAYPDMLTVRCKRSVYAAEIVAQYTNDQKLTAKMRKNLLNELLSETADKKVEDMVQLSQTIKSTNKEIIAEADKLVIRLTPNCGGLITIGKNIFDKNKVCGKLLHRFHIMAVQYQNISGNQITELFADNDHQENLNRLITSLRDQGYKAAFNKSKLVISGDWERVKVAIIMGIIQG